ncbi:MAG: class I SAM-dependent rRNA methyltransferase [Clostridia bacterium]|nr:class I SAM-dependent rRNA methyltransferase [Clostridia bacterium]
MKLSRAYPVCLVTKKGQKFLESGRLWVYAEEVVSITPTPKNGEIVDVVGEGGKYLGTGLLSEVSKIRVRVLSKNANDRFDTAFWRRRIRYAIDYRKAVYGDEITACRLIFGEADGFPGLTVDRFSDLLVLEVLSFGMEERRELLVRLLVEELAKDGVAIRGIFLRNESQIRELEGLPTGKGWMPGYEADSVIVTIPENGITYTVDVENGQKTGFFLDQRLNRRAVGSLAKGKTVLDCFTHTGSFALNAAKGGALHVTAVDISEEAIEKAKENAARNGLAEKMDFVVADVFDLLSSLEREGKHPYDFIILDPPAFTKSRKTVASAQRGYKEINFRAMKLLPRGGFLATCSCSHFMESERFVEMLMDAAKDAGVTLRQIEARQQAPDHPIVLGLPETDYLKFYLFQVV